MSLKLLVGPYRSGKTSATINEALEYARANPFVESVIITPSARSRNQMEQRLRLAITSGNSELLGVMGLRFLTIDQFVVQHTLANGTVSNVLSDQLRSKILANVLEKLSRNKRLAQLESISKMPGTASEIFKLIHEFQRAALTSDEIKTALRNHNVDDSKFLEFTEIYEQYCKDLTQSDWLDQKMLAAQVNQQLLESHNHIVHYGMVIFDGFDRYSRLQAQLAYRLSEISKQVLVVFDYSPGSPDYAWKQSSYELLMQEIQATPVMVKEGSVRQPVVRKFFHTLDRFAEMQEIARDCKTLIVEKGVKPEDILVVARSITPYLSAAKAAFDDAAIPYFVDQSYILKGIPVAQFVSRLLGLSINEFVRADVVNVLRNAYFKQDYAGLSNKDIDFIDQLSLSSSVLSGRSSWQHCLQDCPTILRSTMENFFAYVTPSEDKRSLSQHCWWCESLLEKVADLSGDNLLDHNSRAAVVQIRSSLALLIEEEKVLGVEPISYRDFYQKLLELLDSATFPSQPCFKDYVTICGANVVPNRLYNTVFIAGMVEGEFPSRDRQSPFAGREALTTWRSLGVPIDDPRTHAGFENAMLKFLVECASNNLTLSYPAYEMSGEELLPSFALRQIFSKKTDNGKFLPMFEISKQYPYSAREALATTLWLLPHTDISSLSVQLSSVSPTLPILNRLIIDARDRIQSLRESVFNGYLADLVSSGVLSVPFPEQWSATTLQHYGQCPFQFWVSDILKLSPSDESEVGLESKLVGNFYHYILEQFYRELIAKDIPLAQSNEKDLKDLLNVAIDKGIAWLESRKEFHKDDFWNFQQAYFRLILHRFLDYELSIFENDSYGLKPAMCEVRFGENSEYPALEIPAPDGSTIKIRGTIDRVDLSAIKSAAQDVESSRYARVVDYKRSAGSITRKSIMEGRYLQVPLYALAVEKVVAPNAQTVNAEYLSINGADSQGSFDGPDKVLEAMTVAAAYTVDYDRQMRRGNFLLNPSDKDNCKFCDHQTVCRITELTSRGPVDDYTD